MISFWYLRIGLSGPVDIAAIVALANSRTTGEETNERETTGNGNTADPNSKLTTQHLPRG